MNLGEADRILTIFTLKNGKIKAIAKGVRKTLSKLAGHLEPFCLVNLGIAEGRNLDIVTDAEMTKCFIKLHSNLEATNTAYYLAEIVERMTAENQAHPEIYELLDEVLEHLNNNQNKLLLSYFEINFLNLSGFLPELYKCVACGVKLQFENNYFSFESGGVVCEKCASSGSIAISAEAIKILRLFLTNHISLVQKVSISEDLSKKILSIASLYIDFIAQKEFKSKRFLKNSCEKSKKNI